MDFLTAVVICLCMLGIVTLFVFAYLMDKWKGVLGLCAVAVWVATMQPARAATIKTVTDVDGIRYYDVMTTNPNEAYNGVLGRDPRYDRLYHYLDMHCRGDSGDKPETAAYCNMRDTIK